MDPMLYSKCEHCRGLGVVKSQDRGLFSACRPCDGRGYWPTGVTMAQLETFGDWSRAMQGDPGMPAEKRLSVLLKLKSRVARALSGLTADVGGED